MNSLLGNLRPNIEGHCDDRFQAVGDAFERSLLGAQANEIGSSCAVMVDGELLVDLWGGYADIAARRRWQKDTLACCWSVNKSLCATVTLMLVDGGDLELDTPVAYYWPEFGQSGKDRVTVRQLLNHSAGLSVLEADLYPGDHYRWDDMIKAIEESPTQWPPGTRFGYLNMTFGFLLGELCARANGGRRLAQFVREDLAGPLGLDWHFALTAAETERAATVYRKPEESVAVAVRNDPDSLFARSMRGFDPDEDYNSAAWRRAQIGSGSGHGNARAMARLFGCLSRGGELGGHRLLSANALQPASSEAFHGTDEILGLDMRYSTGFELNCPPATPMGPSDQAFGYVGAGGAFGFADPSSKLGFGYSPNFMHMG